MLCETDLGGGLIMCVFEETANRAKAVASVKYVVAEWATDSFLCTVLPTRCHTAFS